VDPPSRTFLSMPDMVVVVNSTTLIAVTLLVSAKENGNENLPVATLLETLLLSLEGEILVMDLSEAGRHPETLLRETHLLIETLLVDRRLRVEMTGQGVERGTKSRR
jgi:hypothetical protein